MVAGVWQQVLKLDKVGVEDRFTDLGGHSLLMVQVLNGLKAAASVDVTLVDLFRYPTVRSLSKFLSREGADDALKEVAARGEARAAARRSLQQRRRR